MAFVFRLVVIIGLAAASCAAGAITLVFRYDDYSTRSPLPIDLKVLEAFRSRDMAVTFAVIPAIHTLSHNGTNLPLTPERAEILKQALAGGRFEVALHGYSHRNRLTSGWQKSEFVGLPGPEQEKLLRQGREILESGLGIPIRTFVPPWNSFDDQTLAALERVGFTTMSAGQDVQPSGQSPLRFLPGSCPTTAGLKKIIAGARQFGDAQTIVVVVMHPYDFKEHDPKRGQTTLKGLAQTLDWVKKQPDLETRTLGEAGQADATLTAARCRRWQASNAKAKLLPTFWRPPSLYVSDKGFDRLEAMQTRRLAIVYSALLFGAMALAMAGTWLCPIKARRMVALGILAILGLGLAMYLYIIFRHGWPISWSWQRPTGITMLVGMMLGILGQRTLLRRKRT